MERCRAGPGRHAAASAAPSTLGPALHAAGRLSQHVRAVIAGAGPIGLACAISAKRRGIDPLVIDAGAIAHAIVRYPIGMIFFTTPERLEIGGHPLVCAGPKATREEALKYYRGVARAEQLRVRTYTRLTGARREDGRIVCDLATRLGPETITCDTLVLATGYFDHPNRLGVPGEELPHVHSYFDEAHRAAGLDVVVVGGKNSAVEAALQLFRAGARTTIVYRRAAWPPSVKYWLRPDLENRIAAGEIAARLETQLTAITPRDVAVRGPRGEERLPADRVYPLIGFHPDLDLLRRIGIAFDAQSGRPEVDPDTLATSVPGVHVAGSVTAGRQISEIFIENGRCDGDKIFGTSAERARARAAYANIARPTGE
ncbi:MAG: YpdA family putative bacillithiol disulfide reductase [Gemmatimonadales bacterium]